MEPVLRWPGGKRRLAEKIVALFPEQHRHYFEPFVGAGAVHHRLRPRRATVGDLNRDLINFYRQVKSCPEAVISVIGQRGEFINEATYYSLRDEFNATTIPVDRAALFAILNTTCFNGIWRVNRVGQFNVPYGGRAGLGRLSKERLRLLSTMLREVELFHGDFEDCVIDAKEGDLVYLDPPYPPLLSGNESFSRYTNVGFSADRQKDVARVFSALSDRGCFVALSQADTPLIQELFVGRKRFVIEARRTVRAQGSHLTVNELVVVNY